MMTNRKMIRQRVSTAVKDLVLVFLFDLCSIALPVKTVALFQTSTAEMSPELYKQVVKSAGERFDACYSDPQYWTEVMDGNGGYQEVYDGPSMYSLIYHRLKNLGVCSTLQAFELYAVNESHMKVIITYFNWLGIAGVSILVSVAFSLGAVYGGANPYLATFDCIGNIITSLVCSAMAISGALVLYLSFRLVRAFYFEDFTWSGTKTAYKRLHEAVREFHIRSWWEGFSTFVTVPCYQLVVLELLPCIVKVSGYAASGIATLVSTASKGVTQLQEVLRLALRGVPAPVSLPM